MMSDRASTWLGTALILLSTPAYASKDIKADWLKILVRVIPVTLFWTPVGDHGVINVASFYVFEPDEMGAIVVPVIISTAIIWAIVYLFHRIGDE